MRDYFLGATVHCHHKGGNSKAEMKKANTLSDTQLALMNKQLDQQLSMMGVVNPAIKSLIASGGLSPDVEAAMKSAAMGQIGTGANQAAGAINQNLVARGITGGGMAGSGDVARDYGALYAGLQGQKASALQNVALSKQQALMQALGLGGNVGSMYGQQAGTFGGQATSALGIGQNAAQAADQASTGFWGSLVGGLAGMGGMALGGPLGAKLAGTTAGAVTGRCWVAAELYGGWYSDEAMALRRWFDETLWVRPFAIFYAHVADRWVQIIRRNSWLRGLTKELFDGFLRLAHAGN